MPNKQEIVVINNSASPSQVRRPSFIQATENLILGLFPFLGSWKRKYLNCGNWIFTSDVIACCVINLWSSVVTLSLGNEPIYSLPNEIGIWVPRIWHQRQYRPIFYQPAENMAHEPKAKTWRGFRGLKFITLFALDKRSVPWPKRE